MHPGPGAFESASTGGDNIFDSTGLLTLRQQAGGYLGVINLGIDI